MTKKIEMLRRKAAKLRKEVDKIGTAMQTAYNKIFLRSKPLKKALIELESSQQFGSDEEGIYRWVRFEEFPTDEEQREALAAYLSECQNVQCDFKSDALKAWEGPSIVINDEGDILDEDSGKWIIHAKDYNGDERKRDILIEQYMYTHGYFPGVFSVDRHGSPTLEHMTTGVLKCSKCGKQESGKCAKGHDVPAALFDVCPKCGAPVKCTACGADGINPLQSTENENE
jgi:hypothetical protein